VKANVIRRCAEGAEGRRLLLESFELAKALDYRGSPSWLLNNRQPTKARDSQAILDAFCERNDLPECSEALEIPDGEEREPAPSGGCG